MPKHVMVVLVQPLPGQEVQFNTYQTDVHVPEVLQSEGLSRAQRFRLSEQQPLFATQLPTQPYLTLYEIETDDVGNAIRALEKDRDHWQKSASIDQRRVCAVYTAVTDEIVADTRP